MKKLSALLCAMLMALSLASCGSEESSTTDNSSTTTTTAATTTQAQVTEPAVDEGPVDISAGPTEAMMERAILNEGNTDRLKAVINEAKESGEITVAYIGGSITQGSSATDSYNNYVNQTSRWIGETLGVTVNTVNAGIGATDSYLGVHRVDRDVISQNPDIVFVEFSVNDTSAAKNTNSYDSLLYKLLTSQSQPAVLSIIMTQENGTSLTTVHEPIAKHYDIPVISYREVIYPEVVKGNLDWKEISPDNIHPNDKGHVFLSQLIQKYLEPVVASAEGFGTTKPEATYEPYAGNIYANASLNNRESDKVVTLEEGNFTLEFGFSSFKKGWAVNAAESYAKFEITAKNIGMVYFESIGGKGATAIIKVDGQEVATIDADFPGGWGNYLESVPLYSGEEEATHIVEVQLIGEKPAFQIASWLLS